MWHKGKDQVIFVLCCTWTTYRLPIPKFSSRKNPKTQQAQGLPGIADCHGLRAALDTANQGGSVRDGAKARDDITSHGNASCPYSLCTVCSVRFALPGVQ